MSADGERVGVAAARRSDPLPARTVGRYRLGAVLGWGATSVVYGAIAVGAPGDRARPTGTVAVKVITAAETCRLPRFQRRFLLQPELSAAVRHPSLLPVLDAGQHDGRLFAAMPRVHGTDLRRALAAHALTLGRVLLELRRIADALDALHDAGLLHLDVKPSNVLLGRCAGDGPGRAYLADLGLCRRGDEPGDGCFAGSPRYASPEQLDGAALGVGADVYALTCLAYACLSGRPPFVGDLPDVIRGHRSGRAPSLVALAGLPRAVDAVIARGLAPDPDERPARCVALVEAVTLALGRDPTPWTRPRPR